MQDRDRKAFARLQAFTRGLVELMQTDPRFSGIDWSQCQIHIESGGGELFESEDTNLMVRGDQALLAILDLCEENGSTVVAAG